MSELSNGLRIVPNDKLRHKYNDDAEMGTRLITFNVRFYQRYGKHMVVNYRKAAQKRFGPDFFSVR